MRTTSGCGGPGSAATGAPSLGNILSAVRGSLPQAGVQAESLWWCLCVMWFSLGSSRGQVGPEFNLGLNFAGGGALFGQLSSQICKWRIVVWTQGNEEEPRPRLVQHARYLSCTTGQASPGLQYLAGPAVGTQTEVRCSSLHRACSAVGDRFPFCVCPERGLQRVARAVVGGGAH